MNFVLQASLQIFRQSVRYMGEFVWAVILLGPSKVSAFEMGLDCIKIYGNTQNCPLSGFSPEILRGGKSFVVYADTSLLQPSGDYSNGLVNCG